MKTDKIQDVIARDAWESTGPGGKTVFHEIVVGRPYAISDDPNRDWVCPVSIQNFTSGVTLAHGVGPVDALMNAMVLVKKLFDKIHNEAKPTT